MDINTKDKTRMVVCRACGQEMAAFALSTHYELAHDAKYRACGINMLQMSKPKVGMFSSQPARVSFDSSSSSSSARDSDDSEMGSSYTLRFE
jgi:hypothetical protein